MLKQKGQVPPEFVVAVTENNVRIAAKLPGLRSGDIKITVEGNTLRIAGKQSECGVPFESVTEVPPGYDVTQAGAAYLVLFGDVRRSGRRHCHFQSQQHTANSGLFCDLRGPAYGVVFALDG